MNNLKEENIRRAIWHIKRHLEGLWNSRNEVDRKYEMFHLQSSVECLERVMNNEKPYPPMDREETYLSSKGLLMIVSNSRQYLLASNSMTSYWAILF